MKAKGLSFCYLIMGLVLLGTVAVECKRSYGLIRSRPKPNNLSIRRRQQQPQQYTPQSQSSAASHSSHSSAAAPKPAAAAPGAASVPKPSAPVGPPPPYSPHPVKNVGASNAAPPPYTPHHAAPPSYQAAMGVNGPYPNANYPRQGFTGVNNGMAPNYHAMPPNYGNTGMPMGHTPYANGGLYNNPGMGMHNNYNPGMGMHSGGVNPAMGMGMGMGAMGGMGGMGMMGGGYGYGAPQKSNSMFSASNILTGLAIYGAARGVGSMVSGAFGGGYGNGGYGHNTQHVYLHHLNQPAVVTVQGTPVAVQPGAMPEGGAPEPANPNAGVQPLAPAISAGPVAVAVTETPAVASPTVVAQNCTENCNENASEVSQMSTDAPPMGLDTYPTIHPSLFTYAGGTEDILYWANTFNRNLTLTDATTDSNKETTD